MFRTGSVRWPMTWPSITRLPSSTRRSTTRPAASADRVTSSNSTVPEAVSEPVAGRGNRNQTASPTTTRAASTANTRRAGLKSPALIYWYFKDKHARLEAILQRMSPFLSTVAEADLSLDDPPDQVLPRLITGFMTAIEQPQTGRMVRLLMSEFARHPAV